MIHPATTKYLNHYAEAEVNNLRNIDAAIPVPYQHTLVIPAYNETPDFVHRLLQTTWPNGPVLVIIVINTPDCIDPEAEYKALTLWQAVLNTGTTEWQSENLRLIKTQGTSVMDHHNRIDFLLVDRFSDGNRIPTKQGVGRARKIGSDLAAALYANALTQEPWIFSSDADAHLSALYFTLGNRAGKKPPVSAYVLPYQHLCDNTDIGDATKLYESALEYYVRALDWAGSPYAFHTIGSCLCLHTDFYCQARGFPKRPGGEDFYLLNKLAKLAPVIPLTNKDFDGQPALMLEARLSDRVPFGTGPSVKKIIALKKNNLPYTYYAPETFTALKQLNQSFKAINSDFNTTKFLQSLPKHSRTALEENGAETLFSHLDKLIAEGKSAGQLQRHIFNWFDAFKTLKYIHHLQLNRFPAEPLQDAIRKFTALSQQEWHRYLDS